MLFDNNTGYWAILGTLYLCFLTYSDIKTMKVDDRKNYLMMGLSISLASHFPRSLWFYLVLLLAILILVKFMKNRHAFGEGDVSAFTWSFSGFAIIHPQTFLWYVAILTLLTLFTNMLKHLVFKYKKPTPYFPVILAAFVLTCVLFKLY